MQSAVPELMDLSRRVRQRPRSSTASTRRTSKTPHLRPPVPARPPAGRARRALHRAHLPQHRANDRWDAHSNLRKNHAENALAVDQPIAGLLKDLKSRGLLDETLVVLAGEFGRTPFAQGSDGRDHNPFGFSVWLAGGGVKGGTVYGATDEYGYKVVESKCQIHDLHATMLHLLGLDHKQRHLPLGRPGHAPDRRPRGIDRIDYRVKPGFNEVQRHPGRR